LRAVKARQAAADERLSLIRAAKANLHSVKAGYKLDTCLTGWVRPPRAAAFERAMHPSTLHALHPCRICRCFLILSALGLRRIGRDFHCSIHDVKQRNDYTRIAAAMPAKSRVNSAAWWDPEARSGWLVHYRRAAPFDTRIGPVRF
jgi:hypothetical protein